MKTKMKCFICFLSSMILLPLTACGMSDAKNTVDLDTREENTIIDEAQSLYDSGSYAESLEKYLDEIEDSPQSVIARVGAAKCQLELENYEMAAFNLSSALFIDPYYEDIYYTYFDLAEKTNNISYAQNAVDNAYTYQIESVLDMVPEEPEFSLESGEYNEKMNLDLSSVGNDPIFFTVIKDELCNINNAGYKKSIPITHGKTEVLAYVVRDGIPSKTNSKVFYCDYEPSPVQFADPLMERLVRLSIGKETGEITDYDCEDVTSLLYYNLNNDCDNYEEYTSLRFTTLSDLNLFPNLNVLHVYFQNEDLDYSTISTCSYLQYLFLDNCEITDISFIKDMETIEVFGCENCKIEDLTPLKETGVSTLYIDGNANTDIEFLRGMELNTICLNGKMINDISVLSEMENLNGLYIYGKDGFDLAQLSTLENLTGLGIYPDYNSDNWWNNMDITDISFLGNLTKLVDLRIDGLQNLWSVDTNYIKNLSNLQSLSLYNRNENDTEKDVTVINDIQEALPNCSIYY